MLLLLISSVLSCAKEIASKPPTYEMDRVEPISESNLTKEEYKSMWLDAEERWQQCETDLKNVIQDTDDLLWE